MSKYEDSTVRMKIGEEIVWELKRIADLLEKLVRMLD